MLYRQRSFTCPASNQASDIAWDLSFLTKEEFIKKHKVTEAKYEKLKEGK